MVPERKAIADPERHGNTKDDPDLVGSDVHASQGSRSNLTQVQRHGGRHDARPDAGDDAPNNHHGHVHRGRLQYGAETQDTNADEACPATSEPVVGRPGEEGKAEELAGVEDGGYQARVAGRRVVERFLESRRDVDGAEDANVVAANCSS